jgi:hypothetical protein
MRVVLLAFTELITLLGTEHYLLRCGYIQLQPQRSLAACLVYPLQLSNSSLLGFAQVIMSHTSHLPWSHVCPVSRKGKRAYILSSVSCMYHVLDFTKLKLTKGNRSNVSSSVYDPPLLVSWYPTNEAHHTTHIRHKWRTIILKHHNFGSCITFRLAWCY